MTSVAALPSTPPASSTPPAPAKPTKAARYSRVDLLPALQLIAEKVIELAIHVFATIGFIVTAEALLPLSICATVLPFIKYGAIAAASLLFLSRNLATQKVPPPKVATNEVAPKRAPAPVAVPIPAEAPRGLRNGGNNCWMNALAQVLRADSALSGLFLDLPETIEEFSEVVKIVPCEILLEAAELEAHPITSTPFNPNIPKWALPDDFAMGSDEEKARFRQQDDQKIFNWILKIPEFGLEPLRSIALDQIFSPVIPIDDLLPIASFDHFPAGERPFRRRKAKEFVVQLRKRELAKKEGPKKEGQRATINSFRPQAIPANFQAITAVARENFRQRADQRIVQWMSSIKESELIPFDVEILFSSENPAENILNQEIFDELPEVDRAFHRENAKCLIQKLRVIALAEQMNLDEKQALLAKLKGYTIDRDVTNEDEKNNFIQRLEIFRSTIDLISFFKEQRIVDQPLPEGWDPNEAPLVPLHWFDGVPEDERDACYNRVVSQITAMKEDEQMCALFQRSVLFFHALTDLGAEEREKVLSYLTIVHSFDNRSSSLEFLRKHHHFFAGYEGAKLLNQPIAQEIDSGALRAISKANFPLFSPRAAEQCDPAEALGNMSQFLPPKFHVNMVKLRHCSGEVLDPITGNRIRIAENPIRRVVVKSSVPLELDLVGNNPNLTEMLAHFFDNGAESEPIRLRGVDGMGVAGIYNFPVEREQNRFEQPPESLWLQIKRFDHRAPVPNFFQKNLPFFFSPPEARPIKFGTPVVLPDTLEITTIADETVQYKLDAFIVHHGLQATSGHYTAYKLEETAEGEFVWYETDDQRVRKVEGEELARLKKQAYIPHYSRLVVPAEVPAVNNEAV